MQDELSDVAIRVLAQCLDELGHVEKDQVDGVLRERAHGVLQDHGVAAAAVGREHVDGVDGRDGRPCEQPAEGTGCGLLREEQAQGGAAMRHAVRLGADELRELGAQLGLGEALDHVHGDAWIEAPGCEQVAALHLHAGRRALGMLRRVQPHEQARLFAGVERLQQMEALLDVLDGARERAVRDEALRAVQHRVLRGVRGRRRHERVGSQRRVAQQGRDGAHVQEFLGAAAQVAAVRPHGRLCEPGEGEAAHGVTQTRLDEHVEARGLEHTQAELHERRVGESRERMQAQRRRGVGHVQDEAAKHGDERGIAAARAFEAVAEQLEDEEVAGEELVGEAGLAGDARGVRGRHVRLARQRGLGGQLRRVQAAALARGVRPVLGDGADERGRRRGALGEQPRPGARRGAQRCLRTHLHRHADERREYVGVGRRLLHEERGAAVHEAVERVVRVRRGGRERLDLRAERGLGRRGRPAERRALHEQRVRDVSRVVAAHLAEADALRAAARDVQRERRAEAVGGRVGLQVAQERAVQRAGHVDLHAREDIAHAARHALEQGAAVRVHVREVDRHAREGGGEGVLRHERGRQLAVAAAADERDELEHRRHDLGARKQPRTRRHEALQVRVRLVTHGRARVAQRDEHVARLAREARVGRVRAAALRHMHEERGERALDHRAQRRVHGRRRDARVHEVAQRHRRTAARRAAPLDVQHGVHEREARERQRARLERAVAEDGRQRVAQRVRRRSERVVAQHIVRVDVVVEVVARRRGHERRRLERDRVQRIAVRHRRRQRRRAADKHHDDPRVAEQVHELGGRLPVDVHVRVRQQRRDDVHEALHGRPAARPPRARLDHERQHVRQHQLLPQARRRFARRRVRVAALRLGRRRQRARQLQRRMLQALPLRAIAVLQRMAHRIAQRRVHVHEARAWRRGRERHEVREHDADRQLPRRLRALQQQRHDERRVRRHTHLAREAREHGQRRVDDDRVRLARDVIQHRVHRRRRRLVLPRGADARRHARRRQVRVRIERRDRRRRLHPPPDVVQQLERERRTHMREDRGAFERCALRRHIVRRRSLAQHVAQRVPRVRHVVRARRRTHDEQLERRTQLLTRIQLGMLGAVRRARLVRRVHDRRHRQAHRQRATHQARPRRRALRGSGLRHGRLRNDRRKRTQTARRHELATQRHAQAHILLQQHVARIERVLARRRRHERRTATPLSPRPALLQRRRLRRQRQQQRIQTIHSLRLERERPELLRHRRDRRLVPPKRDRLHRARHPMQLRHAAARPAPLLVPRTRRTQLRTQAADELQQRRLRRRTHRRHARSDLEQALDDRVRQLIGHRPLPTHLQTLVKVGARHVLRRRTQRARHMLHVHVRRTRRIARRRLAHRIGQRTREARLRQHRPHIRHTKVAQRQRARGRITALERRKITRVKRAIRGLLRETRSEVAQNQRMRRLIQHVHPHSWSGGRAARRPPPPDPTAHVIYDEASLARCSPSRRPRSSACRARASSGASAAAPRGTSTSGRSSERYNCRRPSFVAHVSFATQRT